MDVKTLSSAMEKMIDRANELHDISVNKEHPPLVQGRAEWERQGILFALKTLVEESGLGNFEDICERK